MTKKYVFPNEDLSYIYRQKGFSYHRYYYTWKGMLKACYAPTVVRYETCGGRGIRVCKEWHNVANFIEFMESLAAKKTNATKKLVLSRINKNDHFYPDNCVLTEFSKSCLNRVKRKSNPKLTLDQISRIKCLYRQNRSVHDLAKDFSVPMNVIYRHLKKTEA